MNTSKGPLFLVNLGDAIDCYGKWPRPTCIIVDGFSGVVSSEAAAADEYARHIEAWTGASLPSTTLWLWKKGALWAKIHPLLEAQGWLYEETVVHDLGLAPCIANHNPKTMRLLPCVTQEIARYTRRPSVRTCAGEVLPLRVWLRHEWQRSALPLQDANEACGVKNAAVRKWLCASGDSYIIPDAAIIALANWANEKGAATDRPYFSFDGQTPLTLPVWREFRSRLRNKWNCDISLTSRWSEAQLRPSEIIMEAGATRLHPEAKPIGLMARMVLLSTDPLDVVWEPFAGLAPATTAAVRLGRLGFAAELRSDYCASALARVENRLELLS
jgi:site-specific DNA-methyltransferase (adenine-specific)